MSVLRERPGEEVGVVLGLLKIVIGRNNQEPYFKKRKHKPQHKLRVLHNALGKKSTSQRMAVLRGRIL